jgi:hemerythrin
MTDPRMSVGVPEMDGEHELQLEVVRALEASVGSRDRSRALDLLRKLEDITNAHFLAEQLLMRQHAYPAYQAHQQEHDRLIGELATLKSALEEGWEATPRLDTWSVELWLLRHIQSSDRALAAFLTDRRTPPRPTTDEETA